MRQPFWTICLNGCAGRTATGASRGSPGSSLRRPKTDLVFTTRTGHAIEPRNINRSFDARCAKAGVRRLRVHDTRRTCGSLLAALDVHPEGGDASSPPRADIAHDGDLHSGTRQGDPGGPQAAK